MRPNTSRESNACWARRRAEGSGAPRLAGCDTKRCRYCARRGRGVKKSKGRSAPSESARGFVANTLIVGVVAVGLLVAGLLNRDTGAGHWLDLRRDAASAKRRIAEIEARTAAHEAEAAALRSDPLAIEAAIREDLGLARPGEWVVREEGLTSLRNP